AIRSGPHRGAAGDRWPAASPTPAAPAVAAAIRPASAAGEAQPLPSPLASGSRGSRKLAPAEERLQFEAAGRQRLGPALLTIDHRDRRDDGGTGLEDSLGRGEEGAAAGDDIVDDDGAVGGAERWSFDGAAGAVGLHLL